MPTKEQLQQIWATEFAFPETRRTDDPAYRQPQIPEVITEFKVGDKVTRKNINAFKYMQGINGEIVEKTSDGRNKIKWEVKASNGQCHSSIKDDFLIKINNQHGTD